MLMGVFGDPRSGKTAFLTLLALEVHRLSLGTRPIYSNFFIDLPEVIRVEPSDLFELDGLQHGDLFLQEAYTWFESRTSMRDVNLLCDYFVFQAGKRDVNVCYDAQLESSIDLRLWELTEIKVFVEKKNGVFKYTFVRCGKVFHRRLSIEAVIGAVKDVYRTGETSPPLGIEDLKCKIDKYNPERWRKRVGEAADLLWSRKEEFGWRGPRDVFPFFVKDQLSELGLSEVLAGAVCNRLKSRLLNH